MTVTKSQNDKISNDDNVAFQLYNEQIHWHNMTKWQNENKDKMTEWKNDRMKKK